MISPDVDVEAASRFARYAASRPSEHDRLKDYWTRWFNKGDNPHMSSDKPKLTAHHGDVDEFTAPPKTFSMPDPWPGLVGTPNAPCCREPLRDSDLSILTEAHRLVHGDRQASYGHPAVDFSRTAALVNNLLASKLSADLDAADVALFMVCVKLSREAHQHGRDNLVDACGYLECRERVLRFFEDAPRTSKDAR